MSYGGMFTDVIKFKNADFFDAHDSGEIFLDGEKLDLEIVAFGLVKVDNEEVYGLKDGAVTEILKHARHTRDVGEGRFVLLSTCDAQDKTMRDVLLARILE